MDDRRVVLVGNPNVGKSTLFNALTGLRQHTGNWPGKTVEVAVGSYGYHGRTYHLTDLPGLYSLQARSEEERVAAQYMKEDQIDCAVVVCDVTCLARSLILALEVTKLAKRMIVCLNLSDEARQRGIQTDAFALSRSLKLPVIETSAGSQEGLEELKRMIHDACDGFLPAAPCAMADVDAISMARRAATLASQVQVRMERENTWRTRLDTVFMRRAVGYPAAFVLLLLVLWLTIWGANYPGILLERLFSAIGYVLDRLLRVLPATVHRFLLDGIYDTVARVVTVMLPPMAIFFPLFSLLEDLGVLPRLAFLLDRPFERCGVCGKQALTSCMSLGCNAVGVTGCRIIDSPSERLLAIMTCSFLPCNGRFPTLILLITMLFSGRSIGSAFGIALCLVGAMAMVMAISYLLSRTVLKGTPSGFVMELPSYRRPRVLEVVLRSLRDRTMFVLGRAVLVAAPAGAILWLGTHIQIGETSLFALGVRLLEPLGVLLGMNGAILLAFVLGFPANELVTPILVMLLTGAERLGGDMAVAQVLRANGVSGVCAICMLIFCLFHWPCGTTVLTVYKETKNLRWTIWSILLPTAVGMLLCMLVHLFA